MEEKVLDEIIVAAGLPYAEAKKIIKNWIMETGKSPQDMTLEDFREVLVQLIQNLFVDVTEGNNQHISLLDSNAQR